MSIKSPNQSPVRLIKSGKHGMRTQFGALCWRYHNDKVQVALVSSRRRKRWIIPKGWPMEGTTPPDAAATEAWEEGGFIGSPSPICIGLYLYTKTPRQGRPAMPCAVAIYPMQVKDIRKDYPEKRQRKRKWVSRKKAASMVAEPELAQIIARFDPTDLRLTKG